MRVPKWAAMLTVGLTIGMPRLIAQKSTVPRVPASVMEHRLVVKVPPLYPLNARQSGVQGAVAMRVVVGESGKVESAEAVSGPRMLQLAAVNAVRQWVYKPWIVRGKPVQVETTVRVTFSLNSRLSDQILPT